MKTTFGFCDTSGPYEWAVVKIRFSAPFKLPAQVDMYVLDYKLRAAINPREVAGPNWYTYKITNDYKDFGYFEIETSQGRATIHEYNTLKDLVEEHLLDMV